jgi:hypothetical protein
MRQSSSAPAIGGRVDRRSDLIPPAEPRLVKIEAPEGVAENLMGDTLELF